MNIDFTAIDVATILGMIDVLEQEALKDNTASDDDIKAFHDAISGVKQKVTKALISNIK